MEPGKFLSVWLWSMQCTAYCMLTGAVKEQVEDHRGLCRDGMEVATGLLLIDPNLVTEIFSDVGLAWLVAIGAVAVGLVPPQHHARATDQVKLVPPDRYLCM